MDREVIRSAEALHLMERDHEDGRFASLEGLKKKKRKTRHERASSGLTRQRQNWLLSSSSDDNGGKEQNNERFGKNHSVVTSIEKRSSVPLSTDDDDGSGGVHNQRQHSKVMTSENDPLIESMSFRSKMLDVPNMTTTECDSSTICGFVNVESINCHANTRREMQGNCMLGLGRSPKLSLQENSAVLSTTESHVGTRITDNPFSENSNRSNASPTASVQLGRKKYSNPSPINDSVRLSDQQTSYPGNGEVHASGPLEFDISDILVIPDVVNAESNFTFKSQMKKDSVLHQKHSTQVTIETKPNISAESKPTLANLMACQFPSDFGPVVDICVVKDLLYVGHSNYGVCVHAMDGSQTNSLVSKYSFPLLQCMSVAEIDNLVALIVGHGSDLVLFPVVADTQKHLSCNFGTTVKCLLLALPLIFAGLETGEIGVFDTKELEMKDKFLCAACPIHCLVMSQKGSTQLLCASSQDGTIIIMDAGTYTTVRILRGQSRIAFPIQAEGSYLYSGSEHGPVVVHNLNSGFVEHIYRDHKGMVNSIFCIRNLLFTGGVDKLVRCYDTKTRELIQVSYGAQRGIITKLLVHNQKIITGNISGSVAMLELSLDTSLKCPKEGCNLNFGNQSHLLWHILEEEHSFQRSSNGEAGKSTERRV